MENNKMRTKIPNSIFRLFLRSKRFLLREFPAFFPSVSVYLIELCDVWLFF